MQNPFYRALAGIYARHVETERRHRDHRTLANMSDHELYDIGLTRADIATAIRTGSRPKR